MEFYGDILVIDGKALLAVTNLLFLLTFIVAGWFTEWRLKRKRRKENQEK